jgi:hypothetical protein
VLVARVGSAGRGYLAKVPAARPQIFISQSGGLARMKISILVSPAELIDRLLIARLKVERLREPVKIAVARRLLTGIETSAAQLPPAPTALVDALDDVHRLIWDAEERIRAFGDDASPATVAAVARQIVKLNDRRARLKSEIDLGYGAEPGDVKDHT